MSKLSDWIEAHQDDKEEEHRLQTHFLNKDLFERQYAEACESGNVVECKHCHYPQVIGSHTNDPEMVKHQVCFTCWYWLIHMGLEKGPMPGAVIVDGVHYFDSGNQPGERKQFLGFGGSKWAYRKIGESEWVESNNLWYQGPIPKRFNIASTHEFRNHSVNL